MYRGVMRSGRLGKDAVQSNHDLIHLIATRLSAPISMFIILLIYVDTLLVCYCRRFARILATRWVDNGVYILVVHVEKAVSVAAIT